MNRIAAVLAILIALPCAYIALASETDASDKTIALFNGTDLSDWHMYADDPDVDPADVFKVHEGAIWAKGEPFGFIRTKKSFKNYKLTVEWMWPQEPTNSGVLLHMVDDDKIWPLSMEAQLMHQRAGDVVGMGCDFNENQKAEGEFFRHAPRTNDSNEAEPGEWNTYEIICKDDTIELHVNGLLQNKATGICVTEGFIGFQSEGSPILLRNIKLTPLD